MVFFDVAGSVIEGARSWDSIMFSSGFGESKIICCYFLMSGLRIDPVSDGWSWISGFPVASHFSTLILFIAFGSIYLYVFYIITKKQTLGEDTSWTLQKRLLGPMAPKWSEWVFKKIIFPLIYYCVGYSNNDTGMCLKELYQSLMIVWNHKNCRKEMTATTTTTNHINNIIYFSYKLPGIVTFMSQYIFLGPRP